MKTLSDLIKKIEELETQLSVVKQQVKDFAKKEEKKNEIVKPLVLVKTTKRQQELLEFINDSVSLHNNGEVPLIQFENDGRTMNAFYTLEEKKLISFKTNHDADCELVTITKLGMASIK